MTEYSHLSTHRFQSQPIVKQDNQKKQYASAYVWHVPLFPSYKIYISIYKDHIMHNRHTIVIIVVTRNNV